MSLAVFTDEEIRLQRGSACVLAGVLVAFCQLDTNWSFLGKGGLE